MTTKTTTATQDDDVVQKGKTHTLTDDAAAKKSKTTTTAPDDHDADEGELAGPDSKEPAAIIEIEDDDVALPDEEDDLGPGTGPIRLSRSDEPEDYFEEEDDEEGGD